MMRARRAVAGMFVLAAAAALASCVDTSSPKGVASISVLALPSPSVAIGDVLRDSTGAPAPIRVTAFDADGEPIASATATFVALDPTVTVDADGAVHGVTRDTVGARLVGSVGALQTPIARLFVTVIPDQATGGGTIAPLVFPATTASSSPGDTLTASAALAVTVTNVLAARGAQGIVVRYEVVSAPAGLDTVPTAFISGDNNRAAPRDTTDVKGTVSRKVTLRHRRLSDQALVTGTRTDTITIRAIVRYAGVDVPGSPIMFRVPVTLKVGP